MELEKDKRFIYQIIHDLKNPLGAILGLSEVFNRILAKNMNENQKDVIRKIHGHSKFALRLIEDLLDLEKLERGDFRVEKQPIEIRSFLQNVINSNQIMAAEKNIMIFMNIHCNMTIMLDIMRFHQILNNLISNAVKFSHIGSTIDIITDDNDGAFFFKVKDRGVGMTDADMENLFEPFAQVSSKPTGNERGAGLGLSIVKKLVELHSGEVYVESEVGKGSTFVLKIPLEAPPV